MTFSHYYYSHCFPAVLVTVLALSNISLARWLHGIFLIYLRLYFPWTFSVPVTVIECHCHCNFLLINLSCEYIYITVCSVPLNYNWWETFSKYLWTSRQSHPHVVIVPCLHQSLSTICTKLSFFYIGIGIDLYAFSFSKNVLVSLRYTVVILLSCSVV